MRKYIVVVAHDNVDLEDRVNTMLEQGGQLVGGVSMNEHGFAQAMTMPARWKPRG